MPITPIDMEVARSTTTTMISDGKRMRLQWKPGDGDGDSSAYLVERSRNTLKGHPTWKVLTQDISLPINRGSNGEPPHYVYLDDKACCDIYFSKVYDQKDLHTFWPFDYDSLGKIKTGRMNRGRPAYLDDSCTTYASGPLRSKSKRYEFSGAPEVTEYKPLRPSKITHMEREITQELSIQGAVLAKASDKASSSTRTQRFETPNKLVQGSIMPVSPYKPLLIDKRNLHSSSPLRSTPSHVQFPPVRNHPIIRRNSRSTAKPLGLTPRPILGSPYGDIAAVEYRTNPRPISGDLGGLSHPLLRGYLDSFPTAHSSLTPKRTLSRAFSQPEDAHRSTYPFKRVFLSPVQSSSSLQTNQEELSSMQTTPTPSHLGLDGAKDDAASQFTIKG